MTQSELMYTIGDAMKRNPEGWWKEFEWVSPRGAVATPGGPEIVYNALSMGLKVRLKPRTYTLHIEDMPTPLREAPTIGRTYWWVDTENLRVRDAIWSDPQIHRLRLHAGLCYPDQSTARDALEKLTRAMGI